MTKQLADAEMMERMQNGWRGGLPFTVCGNGTLMNNTLNARRTLPRWCREYGLESVNDAGAGDLKWREDMPDWPVKYRAYDLIPRHPSVIKLDITTEVMPVCDLILCRMVLNHIQPRVEQTLELFRLSGAYLAATQFNKKDIPSGNAARDFVRLDLRRWLGEPLHTVQDGALETCRLALWRL